MQPPDRRLWAIEVKRSSVPRIGKGCRKATVDLHPYGQFIVDPGEEEFPISESTIAVSLTVLMERLAAE